MRYTQQMKTEREAKIFWTKGSAFLSLLYSTEGEMKKKMWDTDEQDNGCSSKKKKWRGMKGGGPYR